MSDIAKLAELFQPDDKGAYRASDDAIADLFSEAEAAGMTSAERISLVADVTLRSLA